MFKSLLVLVLILIPVVVVVLYSQGRRSYEFVAGIAFKPFIAAQYDETALEKSQASWKVSPSSGNHWFGVFRNIST